METTEDNPVPETKNNSDEKLIAVLCHAIGSLIIPFIVYLWKKDESPYLAAHAKQALAWQGAMTVGFTVASMLITTLAGFTFGIGGLLFFALPPAGLAAFLVGLFAAFKCWKDEEYQYPMVQPVVDAIQRL